jgi:hypothetical protein
MLLSIAMNLSHLMTVMLVFVTGCDLKNISYPIGYETCGGQRGVEDKV